MYEPLINYQDLFERVKKAVPFLQGDDDQQIVISYKHISLQTFINIDRNESLHVSEAFRNASPCGSEIYRRVYLKVRESDSPFLLKRRSDSKEASAESISTKQQYWIHAPFEAIIQLLLRFVPVLNQTSTGHLVSPFSQASWYDYNVC